jgi:DNA-3-methyladenine glycosylase I
MIKYHDQEWGVPLHNDRKIYEFLVLETFQAGLSWRTVLYKRDAFRKSFAGFDYKKVAQFGSRDINKLMGNAEIIRNRAKIEAAINNAKLFMQIQKAFGSFDKYMWSWVDNKPIVHKIKDRKDFVVFNDEAVAWAKDMKKRGFKFLGPTVVYAHMQATGMVNDHMVSCFRYRSVARK